MRRFCGYAILFWVMCLCPPDVLAQGFQGFWMAERDRSKDDLLSKFISAVDLFESPELWVIEPRFIRVFGETNKVLRIRSIDATHFTAEEDGSLDMFLKPRNAAKVAAPALANGIFDLAAMELRITVEKGVQTSYLVGKLSPSEMAMRATRQAGPPPACPAVPAVDTSASQQSLKDLQKNLDSCRIDAKRMATAVPTPPPAPAARPGCARPDIAETAFRIEGGVATPDPKRVQLRQAEGRRIQTIQGISGFGGGLKYIEAGDQRGDVFACGEFSIGVVISDAATIILKATKADGRTATLAVQFVK
jgi:hypothetical protein